MATKKKKKRVTSTRPVGASLDPRTQREYIEGWYEEDERRSGARNTLQDIALADPLERQRIATEYAQSKHGRVTNLAERGLSARGYSGNDLHDLERTRAMAEDAQNIKLRTAQATFASTIQSLNNRRTALDKQYAVEAGQNIQAGTGRYASLKPQGWTPPSLTGQASATPAAGPAAPAPAPRAAAPAPSAPTGGRPSTTPVPTLGARVLAGVRKARPRVTSGKVRYG